jgi:putative oxidoreductase
MKLGLTALRWVVGSLFFGHGTQKLFGWFGGPGLEATAESFEKMGLRPGHRHATAAGAAEAGGGTLVALGLLTPAAAATLIGVMSTAIRKVHFKNGVWAGQGGYEYNLVLIASMVALADLGPGDLALDNAVGIEVNGPLVALLALAGGVAGSAILTRPRPETPASRGPSVSQPTSLSDSEPAAAELAPTDTAAAEPAPTDGDWVPSQS